MIEKKGVQLIKPEILDSESEILDQEREKVERTE